MDENLLSKYRKAGEVLVSAGLMPFSVSDTLVEIIRFYLVEEELDFITDNFSGEKSLTIEQMKEKSGMPDEEIVRISDTLAKKGFMMNQPNSKGVMVHRLLPLILVGVFEYTFMKELPAEDNLEDHRKIARLYEKLLEEVRENIQNSYDKLLPFFEKQPAVDRTIPVFDNEEGKKIEIEVNMKIEAQETVLPAQTVEEIINKFDDIAVGHCFCRNYNKVLGHDCELNSPSEVCFSFGKSAKHTIAQGFAREASKEEALQILKQAEEAGLVHKAFHNGSDINKIENSICNCCKDCCDTFTLWRKGVAPMVNSTNYLSVIDKEECTGCGICVERCPVDAIVLDDNDRAEREESYCIGCGICARFCSYDAITLKEGMRKVYVPPPRLRS